MGTSNHKAPMTKQEVLIQTKMLSDKFNKNSACRLQVICSKRFYFTENNIEMCAGIAGFVKTQPVVIMCPISEFDNVWKEYSSKLNKKSIWNSIVDYVSDILF